MSLPIILAAQRDDEIPGTWTVTRCADCLESWALDTADWDPALDVEQAKDEVLPWLEEHLCPAPG